MGKCTAINVVDPCFVGDLRSLLRDTGLPEEQLTLEITEIVPYDSEELVDKIQILRELGVKIALDDVGTAVHHS
ncbi:EAL domain-containing protein [Alicyclobacillus sp. SO9]|uniref:EAL domain-containing protein n=1 Tax=Alicyclobacillus sp. SO9 TaxID=2665646 RepID=UPI0018E78758|nr:EAL domain-containing protein [Alicyclobacillus sp. SO9]QQE79569.1 EAL domain-containing protein [Alicyclobacillus sp. SO9]QQE79574.1 EAL domain-containing protein [Alicyclobacillus sp. SO9]